MLNVSPPFILDDMSTNIERIGLVLGIFALVGVGLGLSGMMLLEFAQGQFVDPEAAEIAQAIGQLMVMILFLSGVLTTFFTGPTVGAIVGITIGQSGGNTRGAILSGAVGSFVGFILMSVIAIAIMGTAISAGGDAGASTGPMDTSTGSYIGKILIASLPTTVVGGVSAWLGGRF